MAQGVMLSEAPSCSPSRNNSSTSWAMNIFRRKLGLPTASCAAPLIPRCLFGPPNPQESAALCNQVEEKSLRMFSKRWNFNITGKEQLPPSLESSDNTPSRYEWSEVMCVDPPQKSPPPPPQRKRQPSPTSLRCLKIRNGSPARSSHCASSRKIILKQRAITDYMPNKKKNSLGTPAKAIL